MLPKDQPAGDADSDDEVPAGPDLGFLSRRRSPVRSARWGTTKFWRCSDRALSASSSSLRRKTPPAGGDQSDESPNGGDLTAPRSGSSARRGPGRRSCMNMWCRFLRRRTAAPAVPGDGVRPRQARSRIDSTAHGPLSLPEVLRIGMAADRRARRRPCTGIGSSRRQAGKHPAGERHRAAVKI